MPVVAKVKEGIKDSVKCFMTAPSMVVNDNDDDKGLTKATMTATTTNVAVATLPQVGQQRKSGRDDDVADDGDDDDDDDNDDADDSGDDFGRRI